MFSKKILFYLLASTFLLSSLSVSASNVTAQHSNAKSASALHDEGLKYFKNSKYSEALDVWLKEFALTPRNANTANNIGMTYRNLGDYDTAISYHQKAIELKPDFGHAHYSIGLVYIDTKDYEKAKASFLKAIEFNYRLGVSYYNLGISHYGLREYVQAANAYEKAAELNYDPAKTYYSIGSSYYALKDYEKASQALEKSIKFDPSIHGAHYYLGNCYTKLNKPSLALKAYKKEAQFNSKFSKEAKRLADDYNKNLVNYLLYVFALVVGVIIPAGLLSFLKKRSVFFRPNWPKILSLVIFLIVLPVPFTLIGVFGLMPAIFVFILSMGVVTDMPISVRWVGFLIASFQYFILVFINYLAVCILYSLIGKNKKLIWAIVVILILASMTNIYWAIGNDGSESFNILKIFKELFLKAYI